MFAEFQVVESNGTIVTAFVLDMNLLFDAKLAIVKTPTNTANITGSLTFQNMTLSVKSSIVGDIQVTLLGKVLQLMIQYGLVPVANALIAQHPVPIPSVKGLNLGTPFLYYGTGFAAVMTNFTYVPTAF